MRSRSSSTNCRLTPKPLATSNRIKSYWKPIIATQTSYTHSTFNLADSPKCHFAGHLEQQINHSDEAQSRYRKALGIYDQAESIFERALDAAQRLKGLKQSNSQELPSAIQQLKRCIDAMRNANDLELANTSEAKLKSASLWLDR